MSLVNQSPNPFQEYKKSNDIKRALLKRNWIELPKRKNQIVAEKIIDRMNRGKTKNLMDTDSCVTSEPPDASEDKPQYMFHRSPNVKR